MLVCRRVCITAACTLVLTVQGAALSADSDSTWIPRTSPRRYDVSWAASDPPGMPMGFGAYPKPRNSWSIVFYWIPNAEPDLDHYELDVSGDPCQGLKQNLCGSYTIPGTQSTYEYDNQNLGLFYWYQFRLRAVNTDGLAGPWSPSLYFTSTAAPDHTIPEETHFLGNYPNPFNASTRIEYTLEAAALLELCVFDALGRRVTTLEQGTGSPGLHVLTWDGTDGHGRPVASGVYFAQLRSGTTRTIRRLLLLK